MTVEVSGFDSRAERSKWAFSGTRAEEIICPTVCTQPSLSSAVKAIICCVWVRILRNCAGFMANRAARSRNFTVVSRLIHWSTTRANTSFVRWYATWEPFQGLSSFVCNHILTLSATTEADMRRKLNLLVQCVERDFVLRKGCLESQANSESEKQPFFKNREIGIFKTFGPRGTATQNFYAEAKIFYACGM